MDNKLVIKNNNGNNDYECTNSQLLPQQEQTKKLLARFGDAQTFLQTYSVNRNALFANHPERCVSKTATAPTLTIFGKTFGDKAVLQWLELQIVALSEYSGCKWKITPYQLQALAEDIYAEYHYLRVTELMWFFTLARRGKLGKVGYNSFDPIAINEMLSMFVREHRNKLIDELERLEFEREMEERKRNVVPPPDNIAEKWNQLNDKFSNNNNN